MGVVEVAINLTPYYLGWGGGILRLSCSRKSTWGGAERQKKAAVHSAIVHISFGSLDPPPFMECH